MQSAFYIYIYRDPSRKDEPIYVGKGTGRRARVHLGRKDKSPFANRLFLMKRNDINPTIEIIPAINESHAFFLEECCISVIGRKDLGKGTLLNLTNGGEGNSGNIISKSHREKISVALTGIIRSEETKQRNRESHLGTKFSLESRIARSVRQKGKPGKPTSEEVKEHLRILNTGKKIPTCSCILCKREISITNLSRHLTGKGCSKNLSTNTES